jgi:hypothetical protein
MERGLVLVLMLLAAVVLRLAMQLQVLAVLVVFPLFGMVLVLVLAIQLQVLLVVMQLPLYRSWGGDKEVYEIDCIRVAARIPC